MMMTSTMGIVRFSLTLHLQVETVIELYSTRSLPLGIEAPLPSIPPSVRSVKVTFQLIWLTRCVLDSSFLGSCIGPSGVIERTLEARSLQRKGCSPDRSTLLEGARGLAHRAPHGDWDTVHRTGIGTSCTARGLGHRAPHGKELYSVHST
jgi:hypothetical protein